ncbi:MAG: response regulator [SAR324 cluster bacterium]|nr:response regulator [SAR324 cluster bacterium]
MALNKDIQILIVDDSSATRSLVLKILRNLGFENVDSAEDGVEALAMFDDEDYDLVISDWFMPNMSGVELVKEMRSQDDLKEIPVLLVTAEDDQDSIMEAIKVGANNYMVKPYNAKVLSEKIQKIFDFQDKKKNR